jgi:Lon-like ATP-dependent protease
MAVAAVSALTGRPVDGGIAITGEIGVHGRAMPVGGVPAKVDAAKKAGLRRVLIPKENSLERFAQSGIEVTCIETLNEALTLALTDGERKSIPETHQADETLAAQPQNEKLLTLP